MINFPRPLPTEVLRTLDNVVSLPSRSLGANDDDDDDVDDDDDDEDGDTQRNASRNTRDIEVNRSSSFGPPLFAVSDVDPDDKREEEE
jgi:hypothetical protein